jgi:hypothetical protein
VRARRNLHSGGTHDLVADLIERKNLVGQARARDEPRHSPDDAGGFILHKDAGAHAAQYVALLHSILPMPVRITASVRAPYTAAIERKSTSTDGRQKFSLGP